MCEEYNEAKLSALRSTEPPKLAPQIGPQHCIMDVTGTVLDILDAILDLAVCTLQTASHNALIYPWLQRCMY